MRNPLRDPHSYPDNEWDAPFSLWQTFAFAIAAPLALIVWACAVVVIVGLAMGEIAWQDSKAAIRKRLRYAKR